jgi:CTP synthase
MWDLGEHNAIVIHLTLVPYSSRWRIKKKPTQHSSKTLNESKLVLVCRTEYEISDEIRNKLAPIS